MKTTYTVNEFNSKTGIGEANLWDVIKDVKEQDVKITKQEGRKIIRIENMCFCNHFLTNRANVLTGAGLHIVEAPMKTGSGVGRCVKRMANGNLRVRVSANWGGKYGNYANVVHI